MTGEHKGVMGLFGKFVSMDKMIGPDFEKGLARLKAVAEETLTDLAVERPSAASVSKPRSTVRRRSRCRCR